MKIQRYSYEPVPDEIGSFVVFGDVLGAISRAKDEERERCFKIFLRYYDATNFTPDEIRSALKP